MKISVKVVPNSKVEVVERISENEFKIRVKEKAVDGKANESVRNLLAKEFRVSKKNVEIKTFSGRKKNVEILNKDFR